MLHELLKVRSSQFLKPPYDALLGEGERRADGAEGRGFIFQGAQFDGRGILFLDVLNDLPYGRKHELWRALHDPSSQYNQVRIENRNDIRYTDTQHGENPLQN
jgi:hypothetical protein